MRATTKYVANQFVFRVLSFVGNLRQRFLLCLTRQIKYVERLRVVMRLGVVSIVMILNMLILGCSPYNHKVLERDKDEFPCKEKDTVVFLLTHSREEVVVPLRLQKILIEKLSNPENRKRFPKTLLIPIGHFYINGKKWEWCGGRLHSSSGEYYYISELDPPKSSSLYKYTRKYIPKEKRNTQEYAIRLNKLKNEIKHFFSLYY